MCGPFLLSFAVVMSFVATGTSFVVVPALDLGGCTVEHKIDDDSCGELCLSSKIAPYAEKYGGVTAGSCADIGYTQFDHTESVSMGPFGSADVDVYVKPSAEAPSRKKFLSLLTEEDIRAMEAVEGCTVEHKIDDDSCGELCLSSTIAPYAEKYGGVTAGSCADIGYTQFDHTESVSMGPFGSADVDVYVLPNATATA